MANRRCQLQSTGTLANAPGVAEDRALVRLDLVDDTSGYQLPLGSAAEAAIYTQHFHELSLLRKILSAHAKLAELRLL